MSQPTIQKSIETILSDALAPTFLTVENESHMHSGPADAETHFKVVAVSTEFEGLNAVKRHQKIYGLLADYLNSGVHALALHTYTAAEFEVSEPADSPDCMHAPKD